MMIGDEQQQDEQPEGAMVMGDDFQPPPVVNVDVSDELLATHISHDKKTLFGCQWECMIALYGPSLILVQATI